jgi:mRNA-degrading endonuclease toxin of MazEF toxin-antitoxin module
LVDSAREFNNGKPAGTWTDKESVVQCDQIKSLDKSRIAGKRGRFSSSIMKNIDTALKISLALV